MLAVDVFPVTRVDGRSAQVAECSCGNREINYTHAGVASDERLAAAFAKKGWNIDLHRRRFKCPRCIAQECDLRRESRSEKRAVMSSMKTVVSGQPIPSEESVLAKQVMMELLTKGYDLKAHDYREGWTDERIAKESGLSLDFVAKRRGEDFGPTSPPKPKPLIEALARAEALKASAMRLAKDVESISGAVVNLKSASKTLAETAETLNIFLIEARKLEKDI